MRFLDIATILCTGLMIGNEVAVSLFVNPAIWRLSGQAQATIAAILARSLGKAMPFWYALSLVLLIVETVLRRHEAGQGLIIVAILLWVAIIIYTLTALVPINNRIAKVDSNTVSKEFHQDHKKWDTLHRLRILLLIVAMICLTAGILGAG
jgi:uncharacterized membrane protein